MSTGPLTIEEKSTEQPATPLSKETMYGNQVRFFSQAGFDGDAVQRKLGSSRGLVIGGGVIGSHALALLADSGVGILRVLDGKLIEERNLTGHALLRAEDAGRPCGEALKERLKQRNPHLTVENLIVDALNTNELKKVMRESDCALVCLDSPAPAVLDAVNDAALQTKTRWLVGQIYRGLGLIGPTVVPDQSPCYKCYELRRNANLINYEETLQYESRLRQMTQIRSECVAPPPLASLIGLLLALETIRLLSDVSPPQTAGRLLRVDFWAAEMTYHNVLRLPNCSACGYEKKRRLPQFRQLPRR